ncbi:MAG: serine/threonine protein kinase, partial [Acidobacteriota bacterium]
DGLLYGIWDRSGGRAPDELDHGLARRLGMLVGRLHAASWRRDFTTRPKLDADRYIRRQIKFLKRERLIPGPFEARYVKAAEAIADIADAELLGVDTGRLHGDLHLGNVLLRDGVLRLLDFDDACTGPAVQDLWLAIPGRDADSERRRAALLEGYGQFRSFDPSELRLIEVLRGLRLVRYCGWLARRADDPAFQRGWPHFGTQAYWQQETADLEEQLDIIRRRPRHLGVPSSTVEPQLEPEGVELTNKDYFWDWPGDESG